MDYSTIANDNENPVLGASPWSSSPNPQTPSFPSDPDSPKAALESPFGAKTGHSHSYSSDGEGFGSPGKKRPQSSGTNDTEGEDGDGLDPDLAERLQSPRLGDEDYGSPTAPEHEHQHPPVTGVRQTQAPNVPKYKLQAKITGLERTGRKDPILRFDVHVSIAAMLCYRVGFHGQSY
jgi:hypothetical protein